MKRLRWPTLLISGSILAVASGCGSSSGTEAPAALTNPSGRTAELAAAHPLPVTHASVASKIEQKRLNNISNAYPETEGRQGRKALASKPKTPTPDASTAASTSSASVFTALENISVTGVCDYGAHSNSLATSVLFNRQRFPNGAHLSVRVAYARFNPANPGQRITAWSIIGWTKSRLTRPDIINVPENFEHPAYPIVSPTTLFNWSIPVHTGVFKAYVMVAVWNGREWERSPWTPPAAGYYNSKNGVSPVYSSVCWVNPLAQ